VYNYLVKLILLVAEHILPIHQHNQGEEIMNNERRNRDAAETSNFLDSLTPEERKELFGDVTAEELVVGAARARSEASQIAEQQAGRTEDDEFPELEV